MTTRKQTFRDRSAGLAGAKAADTLREEGFDGRVVLIGAEPEPPYERPPLSKEYLRGELGREKVWVHEDAGHYESAQIELRTETEAIALHAPGEVELSDGERVAFDKLLLATGAEPRRLAIPGGELEEIHYLRTVLDR